LNQNETDSWDPTPGESLGYLVRDTYRAYSRALEKRIAQHGVSIGQWYYLSALWQGEGVTQRELSKRTGIVETTTVDALAGMEKAGLITRITDPSDARQRRIFLTAYGRQLKKHLLPIAEEVHQIAIAGLDTEDVRFLLHAAGRLQANLEA